MGSLLRERCRSALAGRLALLGEDYHSQSDRALDTLERELDAIGRYGLAEIFTGLCDFADELEARKLPVQTVGAASSSTVLFAVGLNHVFPLDHRLYFERFLDGRILETGVLNLEIDVPFGLNRAAFRKWADRFQLNCPNSMRLKLACTPRRYLEVYRRQRECCSESLPPPAALRTYWPILSAANVADAAQGLHMPDLRDPGWDELFTPRTWTDLLVLASRKKSRFADRQVIGEYANTTAAIKFTAEGNSHEPSVADMTRAMLVFQEDLMLTLHAEVGLSLDAASQLIRRLAKANGQSLAREREVFVTSAIEQGFAEQGARQLFDLLVARIPQSFCKAHNCCRTLWAVYLSYLVAVKANRSLV